MIKLPKFPKLEILSLYYSPIDGSGLKHLDQHPKLEKLYIQLQNSSFTFEYLPKLFNLYRLDLLELPSTSFDINRLFRNTFSLSMLTLKSDQEMHINGECPEYLHTLDLMTPQLSGTLVLPKEIKRLTLRLPNTQPQQLEQLLAPVKNVESLNLFNTPISEELMLRLAAFDKLEFISLIDTGLDNQFIRNLRIKYPQLRINAGKYDLDLGLGI